MSLPEGERERAAGLVVFLRAQQLAEEDHLAMRVGDLQADDRLAGNDVHHAHGLYRQAARDVLVERRDLADLDARCGLHFEARDDRARIGADDLHVDAEILELEFDLARDRLERFLAVALLLRLGIVEQRQRRNARTVADVEQRDLLFALGAIALFHQRRCRRLDLHGCAFGPKFAVELADFLALLAHRTRLLPVAGLLRAAAEQRAEREHALPDPVHHCQPRQARRQRYGHQQQREQEQVPANGPEPVIERSTDQLPEDAAASRGEIGGAPDAQVKQAGRGHQETDDADQAQGRPQVGFTIAIGIHAEQRDPRDAAEHDRQQEGDVARQVQQHIRQPCAHAAADVVQRRGNASRVRPARIGRRKRHQAREQVEEERRDQDQRNVAPQSLATRIRRRTRLLRGAGALAADGFLERTGHRAVRP